MTPLNLEQTLSYLRERMPAPFDLPQLASLCRIGQVTPFTSFVGIIATDYAPYELETLNSYITSLEFQRLLDTQSLEQSTITTALKFDDLNNTETWQTIYLAIDDKVMGEGFFKDKDRTPYDYACNGFIRYPNGVTITRNDLLFDLEQLESITGNDETAKLHTRIAELENELATLRTNTQSDATADMVKVPHQSYRTIDRILYAIIQLSGADNSEPYSQNNPSLNAKITTILQNDGLPLEYEAVGKWLARANDLKPINKK